MAPIVDVLAPASIAASSSLVVRQRRKRGALTACLDVENVSSKLVMRGTTTSSFPWKKQIDGGVGGDEVLGFGAGEDAGEAFEPEAGEGQGTVPAALVGVGDVVELVEDRREVPSVSLRLLNHPVAVGCGGVEQSTLLAGSQRHQLQSLTASVVQE